MGVDDGISILRRRLLKPSAAAVSQLDSSRSLAESDTQGKGPKSREKDSAPVTGAPVLFLTRFDCLAYAPGSGPPAWNSAAARLHFMHSSGLLLLGCCCCCCCCCCCRESEATRPSGEKGNFRNERKKARKIQFLGFFLFSSLPHRIFSSCCVANFFGLLLWSWGARSLARSRSLFPRPPSPSSEMQL